jgi:UDP-N-acetylglucosamine 1-carboxyvinyltransferase
MEIPLVYLRRIGLDFFQNSNSVWVSPQSISPSGLQPFEVACGTHPGIISDMQPFYVLLALYAKGRSLILDYRYPERTTYLEELSRFYPNCITWNSGKIIVNGYQRSSSAVVTSTDLRGSMALVMAAIINHGPSQVRKVNMALRGYDQLEIKLKELGIVHSINKDDE